MKSLARLIVWTALAAVFFFLFALPMWAQTNALALSGVPGTKAAYWDLAISAVAPVIVWGVAKLNVPRNYLALMTPVVGVLLGLLLNWLASANLSWVDMAKAGALAVFIREVVNQNVTQKLQVTGPS